MQIQKITDLNIDKNGLEYVEHFDPAFPLTVFHDEVDKYANGCIRWHWHPQLEFVLALSEVEIHTSDERLHLAPGDGAFINAGQLHMFCSVREDAPACAYTMIFSPELIAPPESRVYDKSLLPVIGNAKLPFIHLRCQDPAHAPMLEKLRECIDCYKEEGPWVELALKIRLSELWLELLQGMDSFPMHMCSRQNRQSQFRLKQMLSYIRLNYVNHITLEDIANAALVSKSECLRCFRSRFHMTPIQYLIQCRLELACHLLRSTDMNVREISARCGFEDAGYFGRVFRKRHGMTPLSYRTSFEEIPKA